MFIIGITGPSGSGKSTVCSELMRCGINVIDADKISKDIIDKSLDCRLCLARYFGMDILDENNNLIRNNLAKKAFLNLKNTEILNTITHPLIIDQIKTILKQYEYENKNIVVLDVPLLFESGLNELCNLTIAIIADEETRLKRILKRDNINEKLIKMRFSVQNKEEFYTKRADCILLNDGDIEDLYQKIYVILTENIGENNETQI